MWLNEKTLPRFFQLLTRKFVNTAKKNALKLVRMPSLNVICWKLTRMKLWNFATLWSNIREVKHRVYVKRQTRICATWPSFPFTCRLLFIISTHILVVSRNFFIHKNCFELFLSAHFLFWDILNVNLTFAVCLIGEAHFSIFAHF